MNLERCFAQLLASIKIFLQKIRMDEIPNFPKVEDVSLNTEKLQSLGLSTKTIEENILEITGKN